MDIGMTSSSSSSNNTYNVPLLSYLLQATLRSICTPTAGSDWVYAVLWRILPRNYPPPKWDHKDAGSSIMERSKGNKRNWILVWEDAYCDSRFSDFLKPGLFFRMSHDVYNYGEGLMGKTASDNSHKWIYKEPFESDNLAFPNDPHPRTWEAQFSCGIETIAVVAVKEGLLQLGSMKKVVEDLNLVIFLQRKFHALLTIPRRLEEESIAASWIPCHVDCHVDCESVPGGAGFKRSCCCVQASSQASPPPFQINRQYPVAEPVSVQDPDSPQPWYPTLWEDIIR